MFSGFEVRWLKVHNNQDPLFFFGLQVVLAKLWSVFVVIILLQYESFSQRCKPEGTVCLQRMEQFFSLVRVESIRCRCRVGKTPPDLNIHITVFHCGFDTLWCHQMLVFLSPPQALGFVSPPEKLFRNCYSSSETTITQPTFDSTFADWTLSFFISQVKRGQYRSDVVSILGTSEESRGCILNQLQARQGWLTDSYIERITVVEVKGNKSVKEWF